MKRLPYGRTWSPGELEMPAYAGGGAAKGSTMGRLLKHHFDRIARAGGVFLTLGLLLAPPLRLFACTTFCLKDGDHVVFGRNYDWEIGDGLIFVNKRGMSKVSAISPSESDRPGSRLGSRQGERPARWVSKYGSVTFNQYGGEFPTGGMNEKGLVVDLMWLDETQYPPHDTRPVVSVLEWIQYQLDTRASVAEVVHGAGDIRIKGKVPIHYLVADRSGAAASIEFLGGKLVVHEGPTLPLPVLTNSTYESSLASAQRTLGDGFWNTAANGGAKGEAGRPQAGSPRRTGPSELRESRLPQGPGSLQRFTRASAMVAAYREAPSASPVDGAFRILANVAQGDHTRWSIVYDLTHLQIQFRTWNHPEIRSFHLTSFDFSCSQPVQVLDVTAALQGDVTDRFTRYTHQANLDLIAGSFSKVEFLRATPRAELEEMARHPEAMACSR